MSNKLHIIFALFLVSTVAVAQEPYKCKVNGAFVYQDSPCKVMAPAKSAPILQAPTPAPASPVSIAPPTAKEATSPPSELERQKAFLARSDKNRKISDLKYEIERTEGNVAQMQSAMHAELAVLESKKSNANNNLAGATYLNSLANERQAVTARYEIDIGIQRERLKHLREDLVKAQAN